MAIPDYQSLMLPLLQLLRDQKEHNTRDFVNDLAEEFKLTADERKKLLPSGKQPVFNNRVGWARTYLNKAGLIKPIRRGCYVITERGLEVLRSKPKKINVKFLEQFDEFVKFKSKKREKGKKRTHTTPEEDLESAYQILRDELASEILLQIKNSPPGFFERLVVELLVKMGYGGSLKDAGEAVGKSGDEGIDGIIKEDRLGLDIIYVQAKRWLNTIGRPEIQKFAGALQGQRARKGIFITTSEFSREAKEYASRIDTKIVLIDGNELAQHMIDYNIGVTPVSNYELKKIDTDYFTDV